MATTFLRKGAITLSLFGCLLSLVAVTQGSKINETYQSECSGVYAYKCIEDKVEKTLIKMADGIQGSI